MKWEPESQWLLDQEKDLIFPFFHILVISAGEKKTYVDLGCSHPFNKSLTAFVRDLGWSGLAIDGNQDYTNDWAAAGFGHHFVCAVLSDQPTARFVIHDNSFTSRISDSPESDHPEKWGIKRVEERQTVPLEWILTEHEIGRIDLLCVDLEGREFEVLQTLNWELHQPAWVIAEYVTAGAGVDIRVAELLLSKGYQIVHLTSSNIIYRRK